MKTPKQDEWLDETLLGHLIAELAKFGGFDNVKASQLARILLPHIDIHIQSRVVEELKAVLSNVPMPTLSYEQIENRIRTLTQSIGGEE